MKHELTFDDVDVADEIAARYLAEARMRRALNEDVPLPRGLDDPTEDLFV